MRFSAFLALCAAMVGSFAIYALTWAEQPGDARMELNPHVTRLAFGIEQWPVQDDTDCGLEPLILDAAPPRGLHIVEATFVGEGDWDVGSTLVRKRVRELHVCYDEDAEEVVEVRLRDWGAPEVIAGDTTRATCIEEVVDDWPWPQDMLGRVRLTLRAGHLI